MCRQVAVEVAWVPDRASRKHFTGMTNFFGVELQKQIHVLKDNALTKLLLNRILHSSQPLWAKDPLQTYLDPSNLGEYKELLERIQGLAYK